MYASMRKGTEDMASMKKMTKRGFTLIELMIVVVIIGILAALAIYGVSQYVTNAKTAEARTAVGRIGKDALSAFEGEEMVGSVLTLGGSVGTSKSLCASASALVPSALMPEGNKYQSAPNEWRVDGDEMRQGFSCLSFSMDQAILFQYGYSSSIAAGAGGTAAADGQIFLAWGQAELGGGLKVISIGGEIQEDTAANDALVLVVAPALTETTAAVADALAAGDTALP
jgi:type IV pilus assembly protein PilA